MSTLTSQRSGYFMKFRALEATMIAYCLASLLHFVHNAVFVDAYPNLPASITVPVIYGSWVAITSIGFFGYLLLRSGRTLPGLGLIAVYAALGFDGFAHYSLAAMTAHSFAMNVTIWLEAATAAALLFVVIARLKRVTGLTNLD